MAIVIYTTVLWVFNILVLPCFLHPIAIYFLFTVTFMKFMCVLEIYLIHSFSVWHKFHWLYGDWLTLSPIGERLHSQFFCCLQEFCCEAFIQFFLRPHVAESLKNGSKTEVDESVDERFPCSMSLSTWEGFILAHLVSVEIVSIGVA